MAGLFVIVGILAVVALVLCLIDARCDLAQAKKTGALLNHCLDTRIEEVDALKAASEGWKTRAMLAEGHLSAANALLDVRQRQLGRIADAMKPDEA
jgi:hypothetical protein